MSLVFAFSFRSVPDVGVNTPIRIKRARWAIQHRIKRTKGCLTRDGMLHKMFKLGQCAEKSWRELPGFAHLADVIQGGDFVNGIKPSTQDQAAA